MHFGIHEIQVLYFRRRFWLQTVMIFLISFDRMKSVCKALNCWQYFCVTGLIARYFVCTSGARCIFGRNLSNQGGQTTQEETVVKSIAKELISWPWFLLMSFVLLPLRPISIYAWSKIQELKKTKLSLLDLQRRQLSGRFSDACEV